MQIENDYDKEVYNGDIGNIDCINPADGELVANFDGRAVTYGFGELDMLVPAYAATIHKSQGSEYPAVVIPGPTTVVEAAGMAPPQAIFITADGELSHGAVKMWSLHSLLPDSVNIKSPGRVSRSTGAALSSKAAGIRNPPNIHLIHDRDGETVKTIFIVVRCVRKKCERLLVPNQAS
jgi:hypothetical protein